MFAPALSRWLARRGIHYAWVSAALTFLIMLSAAASLGMPGAFLRPLSQEFGWNLDQISSALALRFSLYGLLGPFSAVLMLRYGVRRVVTASILLVGVGMALATQMHALWQLYVLWGLVLGIGSGLTAHVLGATMANRWFQQRRGLVLGMLTASSATGQLVFLPLAAWLITRVGWRLALLPVGCLCLTALALSLALLRDRPEDLGLRAFGAAAGAPAEPLPARPGFGEPLRALADAVRVPMFWVLAGSFFVCGLSTNGLIQTHFITLCGDYGVGPVPAASVLAMIGAFDFVGTLLSGWLSDRYDSRMLLFWYYGLRGLALLWLPWSGFTLVGLSLFAMFYGLDWVATVPPTVKLASASFDRQRGPMIFGWIFAAHQLGGAVASYGAGLSRSMLLSYSPALLAAGVACLLTAATVVWVRRPAGAPAAAMVRA